MENIERLGLFTTSLNEQCDYMQSLSSILKGNRSYSHPERCIGASKSDIVLPSTYNSDTKHGNNNNDSNHGNYNTNGNADKIITTTSAVSTEITINLIEKMCTRISLIADVAVEQKQENKKENFFIFFFLSLILDVLKAYKKFISDHNNNSKDMKNKRKRDHTDNSIQNGYYAYVCTVLDILLENKSVSSTSSTSSDSTIGWFRSRSCCLKVGMH